MSRPAPSVPPEVHDLAVALWHLLQAAAAEAAEDAAARRDPTPTPTQPRAKAH